MDPVATMSRPPVPPDRPLTSERRIANRVYPGWKSVADFRPAFGPPPRQRRASETGELSAAFVGSSDATASLSSSSRPSSAAKGRRVPNGDRRGEVLYGGTGGYPGQSGSGTGTIGSLPGRSAVAAGPETGCCKGRGFCPCFLCAGRGADLSAFAASTRTPGDASWMDDSILFPGHDTRSDLWGLSPDGRSPLAPNGRRPAVVARLNESRPRLDRRTGDTQHGDGRSRSEGRQRSSSQQRTEGCSNGGSRQDSQLHRDASLPDDRRPGEGLPGDARLCSEAGSSPILNGESRAAGAEAGASMSSADPAASKSSSGIVTAVRIFIPRGGIYSRLGGAVPPRKAGSGAEALVVACEPGCTVRSLSRQVGEHLGVSPSVFVMVHQSKELNHYFQTLEQCGVTGSSANILILPRSNAPVNAVFVVWGDAVLDVECGSAPRTLDWLREKISRLTGIATSRMNLRVNSRILPHEGSGDMPLHLLGVHARSLLHLDRRAAEDQAFLSSGSVMVHVADGRLVDVPWHDGLTLSSFKSLVYERTDIPVEDQRVFSGGRFLELADHADLDLPLMTLGLAPDALVQLVVRGATGAALWPKIFDHLDQHWQRGRQLCRQASSKTLRRPRSAVTLGRSVSGTDRGGLSLRTVSTERPVGGVAGGGGGPRTGALRKHRSAGALPRPRSAAA